MLILEGLAENAVDNLRIGMVVNPGPQRDRLLTEICRTRAVKLLRSCKGQANYFLPLMYYNSDRVVNSICGLIWITRRAGETAGKENGPEAQASGPLLIQNGQA